MKRIIAILMTVLMLCSAWAASQKEKKIKGRLLDGVDAVMYGLQRLLHLAPYSDYQWQVSFPCHICYYIITNGGQASNVISDYGLSR